MYINKKEKIRVPQQETREVFKTAAVDLDSTFIKLYSSGLLVLQQVRNLSTIRLYVMMLYLSGKYGHYFYTTKKLEMDCREAGLEGCISIASARRALKELLELKLVVRMGRGVYQISEVHAFQGYEKERRAAISAKGDLGIVPDGRKFNSPEEFIMFLLHQTPQQRAYLVHHLKARYEKSTTWAAGELKAMVEKGLIVKDRKMRRIVYRRVTPS